MPKGMPGKPPCSIPECYEPNEARGMCQLHYGRWRRGFDPAVDPKRSREQQFLSSVRVDDNGCWIWTRSQVTNGYGAFWDGGAITAHRWAYLHFIAPIPEGLQIDHLCRVRLCCNPQHLEPVTPAENVLRGDGLSAVNARKTECKRGHEFTEANTYIGAKGDRSCRACNALRAREYARVKSA